MGENDYRPDPEEVEELQRRVRAMKPLTDEQIDALCDVVVAVRLDAVLRTGKS